MEIKKKLLDIVRDKIIMGSDPKKGIKSGRDNKL